MTTYGWKQITAPLMRCVQCGKDWYMTQPQPVCIECRRQLCAGTSDAGPPEIPPSGESN